MIDRVWLKALIEGALLVLWEADACDDEVGAARILARAGVRHPRSEVERLLLLGVAADVHAKQHQFDERDVVAAIRGYLQQHSRNPALTRADVARAVRRSESWLAHHLKQMTGRSCVDHLNDFRLADAQRLLTHTTEGIKLIAHTVGCKSDSALTTLFRNRLGVPPSAWRTAYGAHAPTSTRAHEHTSTRAHEHTSTRAHEHKRA